MMSDLSIVEADLTTPTHRRDVLAMTAAYAEDRMGCGRPLPPEIMDRLLSGLQEHPTTLILLAYLDGEVAGIATCFFGFSTFTASPLLNIHDLAVLPEHRGRGIGRSLLTAVEGIARQQGCSRVTLEVLEDNHRARLVYEAAGYGPGSSGEAPRQSLFYVKPLPQA